MNGYDDIWNGFRETEGIGFSSIGLFNHQCIYAPTDLPEYTLLSMNSMGIGTIKAPNTISIFFKKDTSLLVLKNANATYNLRLYSVTGEKVIDTTISDVVNTSHLKKGIYMYHLTSNGTTTLGKVIIY